MTLVEAGEIVLVHLEASISMNENLKAVVIGTFSNLIFGQTTKHVFERLEFLERVNKSHASAVCNHEL